MKKLFILLLNTSFLLTGCLETTQEISLNADGSGKITTSNDMGPLISVAMQMGGGEQFGKGAERVLDSTFSIATMADSIRNLTPEEKALVAKGSATIKMDLKNEQLNTAMTFPFSNAEELSHLTRLSSIVISGSLDRVMENPQSGMGDMPTPTRMEDFYLLDISKGEISRKTDKTKYANAATDQYLVSMKEMATMGMPMKSILIINLPAPAIQVEGKNAVLSGDKKKVTVSVSLEDFFEDAESMEFRIRY